MRSVTIFATERMNLFHYMPKAMFDMENSVFLEFHLLTAAH